MKKNYLFGMLALAAMTMVGCSNDEVVNDYSQDNAIQFGTYVGRDASGRGTVIDTDGAEGKVALSEFGVFAFYRDNEAEAGAEPNFMNNQKVEKDENSPLGNGWTYSPVKYWPNEKEDLIDFYAYAPYEENGKTWNETSVNIEIKPDVTDQIDYLYADPQKGLTKLTGNQEDVKFVFHHALSRIGFKVEAVIDDVNHQGDGVKEDADNEGTDFYDTATKVTVQEVELIGMFAKGGTLSLEDGVITPSTDDHTSFTLIENDFLTAVNTNGVSKTKQLLNKDTKYLMLVPEVLTGVQVRVKYTVTTTDTKLPNSKSEIINDITSKPFNIEFEKGHAYNFVLHLGLTSVKLSAEITEGWTEHDVVVNVPINE